MTLLVLGGYGGTGKVFCRYLLTETHVHVIVAGRNRQNAEEWAALSRRRAFIPACRPH